MNISFRLFLIFVAFASLPSSVKAEQILSDFDDGTLQGWTARLPFAGTLSNPGVDGNPGGFLFVTDTVPLGGGLFADAPAPYTGDLSGFVGLRWDEFVYVRGAGGSRTEVPTELFITGGQNSTTFRLANNPLTLIGQWHTRFVEFDAVNFSVLSGTDSFSSVISNVTSLAMEMDTSTLANGGPESGIDNVLLVNAVPEPSSIVVLSVGAIGMLAFRRRKQIMVEKAAEGSD